MKNNSHTLNRLNSQNQFALRDTYLPFKAILVSLSSGDVRRGVSTTRNGSKCSHLSQKLVACSITEIFSIGRVKSPVGETLPGKPRPRVRHPPASWAELFDYVWSVFSWIPKKLRNDHVNRAGRGRVILLFTTAFFHVGTLFMRPRFFVMKVPDQQNFYINIFYSLFFELPLKSEFRITLYNTERSP